MKRRLPTWSALERAHHCPTSFALPQVFTTSEAAKQGTKNHAAKEKAVDEGDLSGIPTTAAEFLRESGSDKHETEVAYALDVRKRVARRIGTKIERNYGEVGEWEIVGTIDVVSGNRVLDYKSRARVTLAKENFQIRAAALARAEEIGATDMYGALSYLDDGELDPAEFDAFELSGFWDTLAALAEGIHKATPNGPVHEGESWCKYCPAFTACPAKTNLARAMLPEVSALETRVISDAQAIGDLPIVLTPVQAGEAWAKVRQVKQIAERIEDAIKGMARRVPVPLPNGKVLTVVEQSSKRVDLAKCREMYGADLPMQESSYEKIVERKGAA